MKKRYLIHIGGAVRDDKDTSTSDKNAFLHEKEALKVESGQKCSDSEDKDSDSPVPKIRSRWVHRTIQTLLILLFIAVSDITTVTDITEKKKSVSEVLKDLPKESNTKTEVEDEADLAFKVSRLGRLFQHPWSQRILLSVTFVYSILLMLAIFAFHLLYWPAHLTLLIRWQCALYEELNKGATVPWRFIAFKSIADLAIWTIVGVTVLMKSNRLRGALCKCFRWSHAVTCWLFLTAIIMGSSLVDQVEHQYNFNEVDKAQLILKPSWFITRPSLVAYIYSGVVCNAVGAVRLAKYFWNNDVTKPMAC